MCASVLSDETETEVKSSLCNVLLPLMMMMKTFKSYGKGVGKLIFKKIFKHKQETVSTILERKTIKCD